MTAIQGGVSQEAADQKMPPGVLFEGPVVDAKLARTAKARAVLHGRYYVSCEDIRSVAIPVLRHRIITNFNAEAEGLKPDDIVARLIKHVPVDEREADDLAVVLAELVEPEATAIVL